MKKTLLFLITFIFAFTLEAHCAVRNPFIPQLPKKITKETSKPKIPDSPIVKRPNIPKITEMPSSEFSPDMNKQIEQPIINPPELTISGIVWNTDRPQAIINDTVVDIGDVVEEIQIVSINKESVTIEFKNNTFTITP